MAKLIEDPLGDRCKRFEMAEAGRTLMPGLPVLARLDGRAFHTFTRGMQRPFDARFMEAKIDIAKRVFHAVGMDNTGTIVYRKRLSRHDLMPCIAKQPPVRIGIEACGGAHYWARCFRAHGHEVKLMAPQFVKPYGATCKSLL